MPGERILLGPGPSMVPPEVTASLTEPLVGHMDPDLFPILDDIVRLLRHVFQTDNDLTLPLSATGTGAMEALLLHLVKPGDRLAVCTAGFFADRLADIGRRVGVDVIRVEAPWGQTVDPADLERVLASARGARISTVAMVHIETSTGVLQPLADSVRIAHEHGAQVLVDAVASLGGVDLPVDRWGIDACYSGSQKCLSAPPGLAPLTVHARTRGRHTPPSFYFDLETLWRYWGPTRAYHHTVPVPFLYALRTALRLVVDEGLPDRIARHWRHARGLWRGLDALGLKLLVSDDARSPTVTTVLIPEGVDDARVRARLLRDHGIEIAGGLGPLRGKIWRIGLMGHSSQARWVLLLLGALQTALATEGYRPAEGVAAAQAAADLAG